MSDTVDGIATDRLRTFIERIERQNEEIREAKLDLKETFHDAKAAGFCLKTLKRIIAERAKTDTERAESQATYELYARALGMFQPELPFEPPVEAGPVPTREEMVPA